MDHALIVGHGSATLRWIRKMYTCRTLIAAWRRLRDWQGMEMDRAWTSNIPDHGSRRRRPPRDAVAHLVAGILPSRRRSWSRPRRTRRRFSSSRGGEERNENSLAYMLGDGAGTVREISRGRAKWSRGARAAFATASAPRILVRAEQKDGKCRELASPFSKLLELVFCLFCQIFRMATPFSKLLEMLCCTKQAHSFILKI